MPWHTCNECEQFISDVIKRDARYICLLGRLRNTSFYEDPASTKYHCNERGGLAHHSNNVMWNLVHLTHSLDLKWERYDSPMIVAMCHDLCKIGAYLPDGNGGYTWNKDHPKGHGDLSVEIAKNLIELTEEEEVCIRYHMGAFEGKEIYQEYTAAITRFPRILDINYADMKATHYDEAEEAY